MRDYEYEVKIGSVDTFVNANVWRLFRKACLLRQPKLHVRLRLICRSDPAELVERFSEEGEELLQAFDVLDHADNLEVELVDAFGELLAEPALVVFDLEVDVGLRGDQRTELRIGEELANLHFIVPFDDEGLIEGRIADDDVLHAEPFCDLAEETLPVDREAEAVGIHVRRANT